MAEAANRRMISIHNNLLLLSLRPVLKAYGVAYVSTVAPQLLTLVLYHYRNKSLGQRALSATFSVFRDSVNLPWPIFCATIVGGYNFLQLPLRLLYDIACRSLLIGKRRLFDVQHVRIVVTRFLAALISAWFSLQILDKRSHPGKNGNISALPVSGVALEPKSAGTTRVSDIHNTGPLCGGETIDLTILAVARAFDTIVVNIWRQSGPLAGIKKNRPSLSRAVSDYTDSLLFAISSGTVMWAWVYSPLRLPRAYNKWIGEVAQVDPRLIEVLRDARKGRFVYGQDNGLAPVLQGMCKDYGWPLPWGDPAETIPIPCEVVHMGTGPSCHWHAAVRFARAFKFAMATYLPLQLLVKARRPSARALMTACQEAARSSAFLGAFVGLFYYGVCLTRTCLGPNMFSRKLITPMMWDSGLCVRAGCILCGWSILIETEKRRQSELALFVGPRALATLLPREYDRKYFWREKAAFSLSTAVLFTLAHEDPKKVRGILGRLIYKVLN